MRAHGTSPNRRTDNPPEPDSPPPLRQGRIRELVGTHPRRSRPSRTRWKSPRVSSTDTSLPGGTRYSINDVYETKETNIDDALLELPTDYEVMTPEEMLRAHGRAPGP